MLFLLILIVLSVLVYVLVLPIGALLCRYVPIKLTAIVNITLGIMSLIFMFVSLGSKYGGEVFFTFLPVYIYIPNLILYFKMRSLCRRNGVEKEKYDIKIHVRLTTFLASCYFPIIFAIISISACTFYFIDS